MAKTSLVPDRPPCRLYLITPPAISDLDAAMQQALQEEQEGGSESSAAQSAFDALFKDSKSVATASPDDLNPDQQD